MSDIMDNPEWYDAQKIAYEMSVSVSTVRSWLSRGQMPKPEIQRHRFTRWRRETILPFITDPLGWGKE